MNGSPALKMPLKVREEKNSTPKVLHLERAAVRDESSDIARRSCLCRLQARSLWVLLGAPGNCSECLLGARH